MDRQEMYDFLKKVNYDKYKETPLSSVYFLIKCNNYIEPIYFMPYEDVFFESPCIVHELCKEEDIEQYVNDMYEEEYIEDALEYEKTMCRNGFLYEIDCPQCSPFLNDNIEIVKILSESECLEWIIKNNANLEEIFQQSTT